MNPSNTIDASNSADPATARRRLGQEVAALDARLSALPADRILATALREIFPGKIALVSSFGAESAVLLHLVATVDPRTPVIFVDTAKLFPETLAYRDTLRQRLGLTDLRSVSPDAASLSQEDPDGTLWSRNPDRCCALRKVLPLDRALAGFDAWIGGRKRYQSDTRAAVPVVEADAQGRILINPLATWSANDIAAHFAAHDLPHHPLEAEGYRSIGCAPCTDRVADGEDQRAGRWRSSEKTECGIFNRPKDFIPTTDAR